MYDLISNGHRLRASCAFGVLNLGGELVEAGGGGCGVCHGGFSPS
jgi:hypothetical protein